MTDRSKLLALADAVEKLTGPDREADAQIALALPMYFNAGPAYDGAPDRIGKINADGSHSIPGNAHDMLVRAYTASLDAAMTLVPNGDWEPFGGAVSTYNVVITTAYNSVGVYPTDSASTGIHDKRGGRSVALTVPLAICAAALRAQAEALA